MTGIIRRRALLGGAAAAGGIAASGLTLRMARAQSKPILIGYIGALSGPGAPVGVPGKLGVEIARDQINKAGGIGGRMIELLSLDDGANPNNTVAAAREMSSKGINMVVGPAIIGPVMALQPLAPDLKLIFCATGTGDEKLSHEMFNRNSFNAAPTGYTRQHVNAAFLARKFPDVTHWTAALPDVGSGPQGWAALKVAMDDVFPKALGKKATFDEPQTAKFGTLDYKQQLSQLMASSAQGMFTNLFGAGVLTFWQQSQAFGLANKFKVMIDYGADIDLPKALKKNVPTSVWTCSFWYNGAHPNDQMAKDVIAASTATGDAHPHGFVGVAHTGLMGYAAAIQATGGNTDTDQIIAAMEGRKFKSLRGDAYYRKEDHQLIANSYLVRWEPSDEPKAAEVVVVDEGTVVNPPAPGVKWEEWLEKNRA